MVGASKISRDVTEQRRLRAMSEEASRLKDEFLAVLSHELRTPLNTVLGYARMLRREDKRMTPAQREHALDALERNADALSRLVGDILDTSRIVTGKLRLALAATPVDERRASGARHDPGRGGSEGHRDRGDAGAALDACGRIAIGWCRSCGTCSRTR